MDLNAIAAEIERLRPLVEHEPDEAAEAEAEAVDQMDQVVFRAMFGLGMLDIAEIPEEDDGEPVPYTGEARDAAVEKWLAGGYALEGVLVRATGVGAHVADNIVGMATQRQFEKMMGAFVGTRIEQAAARIVARVLAADAVFTMPIEQPES